jgi:DNA modification methylase
MQIMGHILRFKTLNLNQVNSGKQKHVCPLQLDLIERLIIRYSNERETVLDPFGGIMSVPYTAVKTGRFGIGIELSADYYKDGVSYLRNLEKEIEAPTLFEALDLT